MSDDNGIRQYQNPDGSVVIQDGVHGNDIHVSNHYEDSLWNKALDLVGLDEYRDADGVTVSDATGQSFDVLGDDVRHLKISGGAGDDTITVDENVQFDLTIDAGAGNDVVHGGAGNDSILGGDGSDELYGHDGKDRINANGASSSGRGDSESDTNLIDGGEGNDALFGNHGEDFVIGGGGIDSASVDIGDAVGSCESVR